MTDRRLSVACWALAAAFLGLAARAEAQPVAKCGRGYLERVDGHLVLHVKGTPYEMGYQHGCLLKAEIKAMHHHLFEVKGKDERLEFMGLKLSPKQVVTAINQYQRNYLPKRFVEELQGLADGAGISFEDAASANAIPELFHCSGFALPRELTADNTVLHGRVLDYAIDWRLQEHAVLLIAEPEGRVPFANVTYTGFIGSVTGMNAEQVSIGEMGGRGLGKWAGTPMAFLVRRALEEAKSLDEAIAVFRDTPRTCEYYYVLADGRANRAVGMDGSADRFELILPGAKHPRLPTPVPGCVLLSAGERYGNLCGLVSKVQAAGKKFSIQEAIRLMDAPVAMKSNLHNALMAPALGKLWVAHASADRQPAWKQKYHELDFNRLRSQQVPSGLRELPPPPVRQVARTASR